MKNIVPALILFITSCSHNNHDDSRVKDQVIEITKEYNRVWQTLNVDSIAEFHSDKSFAYYWHGGLASANNDHFRKLFSTILSTTKDWSIEIAQPLVQVISDDAAIISFGFEALSTEKNGTKSNETGAITYIWNKINNKWKLVHIHESAK